MNNIRVHSAYPFVQLGTLVSKHLIPIEPNPYLAGLAQEADAKKIEDDAPPVQGTPVGPKELRILNDSSLWLTDPDHQRVQFIGTVLHLIWPVISGAIYKEVQTQAKQPIEDACKMVRSQLFVVACCSKGIQRATLCHLVPCRRRVLSRRLRSSNLILVLSLPSWIASE